MKIDTKCAMVGRLAVEEEFLLKQVALYDRNRKEKAHIACFLHAEGFEDAVRNAVSLGGHSDTLTCIAGAVAGAY